MNMASASAAVGAPATIRNILFATDFSPCSELAMSFATALAKQHHAALFIVHILPPEPRYELPLEPQRDELNAGKIEAQRRFISLLDNEALADVVHAPILRTGEFWSTMQEVMSECEIDFVVTGTRGREGLSKILMGSAADLIFRNAQCPVLTVGPHVRRELLEEKTAGIAFATDFTPASLHAFSYALGLAAQLGKRLTLIHAVVTPIAAIETLVVPVVSAEIANDAYKRLAEMVAPYPAIATDIVVSTQPAAEAIMSAAEERKAGLIVLGVRHKGRAGAHVPWSVADAVVSRARCPVLTVRGD